MKSPLPVLLLALALLAACAPQTADRGPQTVDGGTQTADGGPQTADYPTPDSPTPAPTPTPVIVADFFDAETFPAEMGQYVESLPERNNLDPSEEEQQRYIEQDRAFHQFYMEQMVVYLQQRGVDVSEFEG